jgi:periplasmic protein CpxP/Spy
MKMKMIFAVMAMLLSFSALQAQPQRRTPEERTQMMLDSLGAKMTIAKDQAVALNPIFLDFFKGMDKLREGMEPGTRPDRSAFEPLINERDAQLKKVFTEAQFKQFKEIEPTLMRRGNRQRRQGNGDGQ